MYLVTGVPSFPLREDRHESHPYPISSPKVSTVCPPGRRIEATPAMNIKSRTPDRPPVLTVGMTRRHFAAGMLSAAFGSVLLGNRLWGQNQGKPASRALLSAVEKAARFNQPGCFGIHYDLQPDSGDPVWERDLTPEVLRSAWKKIRPDWIQCDCKGSAGYATYPTKVGYPKPGLKNDPLRIHRDVTRELGLPLLVHFCGLWDLAASTHHRDWTRREANGRADNGKICARSPYLHEQLIPQMLEVAVDYEVDGFWIDADIWTFRPCYCTRCRDAFEAETGVDDPPRGSGDPQWQSWLAFHRRSYREYAKTYVDAVHRRRPDCIICINGMYSIPDPEPVSLGVDLLSLDAVDAEDAMLETRFYASRGLPWNLMVWGFTPPPNENTGGLNKSVDSGQFRTLAEICQGVAEPLAAGGGAIVFARPAANGRLIGWEHDVLEKVADFCRERRAISQNSVSVPQAVVLNSRTDAHVNATDLWQGDRSGALSGAVRALLDAGYCVDIQNEEGLLQHIGEYGLVVVPELHPIPDRIQKGLAQFVEGGGRVILSGPFVATEPRLAQLAGVAPSGAPQDGYYQLPAGQEAAQVKGPWQPVTLTDAVKWADLLAGREPETDQTGTAAITLRKTKGTVAVAHGPIFAGYNRENSPQLGRVLKELFQTVWPDPLVRVKSVANGVLSLSVRRQADRLLVHLINQTNAFQKGKTTRRHIEHMPPIGPIVVQVRTPTKPSVVSLVPGNGSPLSSEWANGLLTVTVPSIEIHGAIAIAHS